MRVLLLLSLLFTSVNSVRAEEASIERRGSESVLRIATGRPWDDAAELITQKYGVIVNSEDPEFLYKGDVSDVTAAVARGPIGNRRILVPRTDHVEVRFGVNASGIPHDVRSLLQSVADTINTKFPFAYRVDANSDIFTLIPTRTRDAEGNSVEMNAILDRHISIPQGKRQLIESAKLVTDQLSAQTGLRISCCQSAVAGVPWGLTEQSFGAENVPARQLIQRLALAEGVYQWRMRRDPVGQFCFINFTAVRRP
jgi:hypothetical protein